MFNLSAETMLEYLVRLMIIFLINPLHECAHALTAYKLGDDTAKRQGRLTLDPIAHIDLPGAVLLFFFGFGWAKPVPVNPTHFKNRSRDMMLTALAGPMSNLIAAFVGVVAMRLIGCFSVDGYLYFSKNTPALAAQLLYYFTVINLNLCLFNLIPVPPLDGSRILHHFLPANAAVWLMRNERVFYGIVMLLMVTGILSVPLLFLNEKLLAGLMFITQWIPSVR